MRKRLVLFLSLGIAFTACSNGRSSPELPPGASRTQAKPTALTPAGEQELRAIVQSGTLRDLQWPNFLRESAAVSGFYEQGGYTLGWIQDGKPTPQALELITILEDADQKGLDSRDYDGGRWQDRLKGLQDPSKATESSLLRFDVALTISAIRYGSDLHLGKVDPKVLHKDFDPEIEKHDPGVFLRQNVVGASSVKQALAPIEPPYPGYQRTLIALQTYLQMARTRLPIRCPR